MTTLETLLRSLLAENRLATLIAAERLNKEFWGWGKLLPHKADVMALLCKLVAEELSKTMDEEQ